jgi:hypothetical protein
VEGKWALVERLVDELYSALVGRVGERAEDRSNIFYAALMGRASIQSRIERTLVTSARRLRPQDI